jgi:uridine kinase
LEVASKQIATAAQARLRSGGRLLIALDGGSGAGKSVLAELVAAELNATVVQGDDFCYAYRGPASWNAQAPPQRAAEIIDWRRMRAEALEPLLGGRNASWQPVTRVMTLVSLTGRGSI